MNDIISSLIEKLSGASKFFITFWLLRYDTRMLMRKMGKELGI
jgi:hypothetical protein